MLFTACENQKHRLSFEDRRCFYAQIFSFLCIVLILLMQCYCTSCATKGKIGIFLKKRIFWILSYEKHTKPPHFFCKNCIKKSYSCIFLENSIPFSKFPCYNKEKKGIYAALKCTSPSVVLAILWIELILFTELPTF